MKNPFAPKSRLHLGNALPFAAAALLLSCRPPQTADDPGRKHTDEPKTAQITVWSDRYEVFAEHLTPVASQPTQFITHITDLKTFEPRRAGLIKFVLRQGESIAEHPQAAPARPGIYLPRLTFPKTGDWQLSLIIPADAPSAPIPLGTVRVYPDAAAAERADIPDEPEGVSFLKEQQWNLLTQTQPAASRRLVERLPVSARVRPKPGFSAALPAPVPGQLLPSPNTPFPQPGEPVAAGQVLALLKPAFSPEAVQAAETLAQYAIAKAALEQTEAAYNRTKKLAAEQAKSARELQEAELAFASAAARFQSASQLLATFAQPNPAPSADSPLLMELRAPISGILNSASAGPGEIVETAQDLFTIVNLETVWIEARIPASDVDRLNKTLDAAAASPDDPLKFISITGPGQGRLLSLGLVVDDATRTVPLLYEISNRDGRFRAGQTLSLYVETARILDALAIPETALVEEGDQPIAFVQVSGETFEKRNLDLGIRESGFVQILNGIKEGERVVTKGAYAIRLSSLSGAIPAHGHAH